MTSSLLLYQGGGTIIDSGTTFTYLPSTMHVLVLGEIKRLCGDICGTLVTKQYENLCFQNPRVSFSDVENWPTLTFKLTGE